MASNFAFVTLVSSDSYLPGALAQVAAINDLHPNPDFQTVCIVTPESVDVSTIKQLRRAFDLVVGVEIIDQKDQSGLKLLGRPDLTTVLTKLHVFRLTQFQKVIFLDADVLPIRPMHHLFQLPHEFSAVPDVGWPDIFNSGVLVLSPGEDKFQELSHLLATTPSWDGGDQGILNEWRGNDWNRLSFTYNTTPTAAYTYAPAYERYGSQINALHFIGPNKPWKSLPYRPPFSGRQPSSPDSTQRTYDYEALVDRWFDVYDRHYRAQDLPPQTSFEVKKYESVWDSGAVAPPAGLNLDQLKRANLEGNHDKVSANPEKRPTEGEYRSMPLEGRIDLMRPRKEVPQVSQDPPKAHLHPKPFFGTVQIPDQPPELPTDNVYYEDSPSTPLARNTHLGSEHIRWHTLPTPGPNEVPNSPRLPVISLPPTPTPLHHFPKTTPDFYASESESESLLLNPVPPDHHHQKQDEQQKESRRPETPPLVSWNPAVEPPPNTTPTPITFPVDTYFANIWDQSRSRQNDQTHIGPSPPDSAGFFKPLPPPEIPESLIKQGHYRNVTGDTNWGATPSPDRSKVKSVFPWEQKLRIMPGRVFPDSDVPPPSLFLSPSSQSQTSTTTVPNTPETKVTRNLPLSPLYGLPPTFNFVNAWDHIPSIQQYASKLARPPPPPITLAPAFEDMSHRRGKREDRSEVSSRDGDDEDNADDEDDDEDEIPASYTKWAAEHDGDEKKARRRSGSGSVLSASRQAKTKKEYRHRGVQTETIEKRSFGVQVNPPSQPERIFKRGSISSSSGGGGFRGRKQWAPMTGSNVLAPAVTKEVSTGERESTYKALPASPAVSEKARHHKPRKPKSPSVSPRPRSPLRSPREFVVAPVKTRPIIPPTKPMIRTSNRPTTTLAPPASALATNLPALKVARRASIDSSLGSPASSFGPLSPSEGGVINSPVRKAGRVWDPARGVELFKRGSEEVLARFLRMGSFDEENAA